MPFYWYSILVVTMLITTGAVIVGLRLLIWYQLKTRSLTTIEITPPAHTNRSPEATQELFMVLHGLRTRQKLRDRILRRDITLSMEIVASYERGIRYVLHCDESIASNVEQTLTTYLPHCKIQRIKFSDHNSRAVTEFKSTGHYAFPLAASRTFDSHDPIAYLTGALSGLSESEEIYLQFVITPVRLRKARELALRILGNEDLLASLQGKRLSLLTTVTNLINTGLFSATDAVGVMYHGQTNRTLQQQSLSNNERLQIAKRQRPARTLSTFELELMETMHVKLNQPLFRVGIRSSVVSSDIRLVKQKTNDIKSALQVYSVANYQELKAKLNLPFINHLTTYTFNHQLPPLFNKRAIVLSASELGNLFHFPLNANNKTDNLITSLSKTLPAPVSLKQNNNLDVIIGQNVHHGINTPIGLTAAERERHIYIIGGTGNGKTTMLQYQIVQDMQRGKGLAIIDPHGDMAETMLKYVPTDRINDVVYFNPDDLEYPIGINLLELSPGLAGSELLREKDLITESVVSVFRKIFSEDDSGGHRIEYVLRNTIQTALTIPDATLFTVFDLLNDPKFRRNVIKSLDDKNLINFWKNELGKAGDMQKVKMAAGITAKIGRFLFSASARQILEQPKSTIDFDDIINSGKILICNFSKGLLGEDTSELFGITVLAKLQLASLRRARLAQQERRAFYLYVDEFQNFATQSFVQMLSEARKYKLFMIMAEQSTSQQDDQRMVSIILANVGTVICFRTGNPQDERLLLPLFAPYIEPGEINSLPSYNFYAKLSATTIQEPLSGQTTLLKEAKEKYMPQVVIDNSRKKYANALNTKNKFKPNKRTGQNDFENKGSLYMEPMIDD